MEIISKIENKVTSMHPVLETHLLVNKHQNTKLFGRWFERINRGSY